MSLRGRLRTLRPDDRLGRWCGLLLPLGVLVHLALTLRWTRAAADPSGDGLRPGLLALAAVLALLPPLLNTWRLRRWLRLLGGDHRWLAVGRVVAAGEIAAGLTPTTVGGASAKAVMLLRRGADTRHSLALVTLGSLEDLSFNLTVPLALVLARGWLGGVAGRLVQPLRELGSWRVVAPVTAVLILAAVLLCVAVARSSRVRGALRDARRTVAEAVAVLGVLGWRGRRVFLGNLLLAWLQWSVRYSLLPLLAAGLGLNLPWLDAALKQWLALGGTMVVPTPGASGGAEALFLVLYRDMIAGPLLPLVMSVWRLVTFYWVLGAAAVFLLATAGPAPLPLARGDRPDATPDVHGN